MSSVYRPPNTKESKFITEIDKLLKSISKCSNLGLIGLDHNLDLLKSTTHKPTQRFLETVLSTSYIPCITRPTRITTLSATLIDNILVSHDIYTNINNGIAISDLSDHLPCIMTSSLLKHHQKGSIRISKQKIREKNYVNIAQELKINWSLLENESSINASYQLFHNYLLEIINKYTEKIILNIPCKQIIKEPWLTKGIISANKKQLHLYKNWLKN